jgi:hypothetical protein
MVATGTGADGVRGLPSEQIATQPDHDHQHGNELDVDSEL